jgi:hypothetical protein
MNDNILAQENTLLFLNISDAISQLDLKIQQYQRRKYLMVVLSQDALPVANQIARASKLRITSFGTEELRTAKISKDVLEFDISVVNGASRDVPQDFIFHSERILKAKLSAFYEMKYEEVRALYPNDEIILLDALMHDGVKFRLKKEIGYQSEEVTKPELNFYGDVVSKVNKSFVYLHSISKNRDGINMIIEQGLSYKRT